MTNTIISIKPDFGIAEMKHTILVMDDPHMSVASFDIREIAAIALSGDGVTTIEIAIQLRNTSGKFILRYDAYERPSEEVQEMQGKMLGTITVLNAILAMHRPSANPLKPELGMTYLVNHQA